MNLNRLLICMLSIVLLVSSVVGQSAQCQKYVQQLIENIFNFNVTTLPLPSIMYSGITTNNPGQFYQCQKTPTFSYYLVLKKNTTTNINSFTGICVPSACSKQDMKIALDFWNCQVYDYGEQPQTDGLATTGFVIFSIWSCILIIWSIVISCKQPQTNQYVKKQKQQGSIVNSLVDSSRKSDQDVDVVTRRIFNYYQGYSKIFKKPKRKSLMGSFFFLSALSLLFSTQFSYKQAISSNPAKSYDFFNSFFGVFATNTQLSFSVVMFILGMKLAYGVYKLVTFHQIARYLFDQLLKKWVFYVLISLSIYGFMSYINQPLSKYWSINFGQDCPAYLWQDWFLFRHFQLDSKVCMPWLWILQADIFLTLISAPFIVIFRVKKNLGYILMSLVCLISMVIAFAILNDQGIIFQPTKIFNMQKQYTINYQTNTFVRAGAFYFGAIFAFFVIESLQKFEGKSRTVQYKIAKKIKKQKCIQFTLHGLGIFIMLFVYYMISAFFTLEDQKSSQTSAYWFIAFSPMIFLIGLAMFVLPSFLQVEKGLAQYINNIFGWSGWSSFQKITPCLLAVGPAVMGFTTFSTQNNIYFDLETILVYLLGNLLVTYVVALLVCAGMQNQIVFIFNWLQTKIFGKENKYSILLLED